MDFVKFTIKVHHLAALPKYVYYRNLYILNDIFNVILNSIIDFTYFIFKIQNVDTGCLAGRGSRGGRCHP